MPRKISLTITLTVATALAAGGTHAASQSTASTGANGIVEMNVTGKPDRVNGQPVVLVNPRNPRNLVFSAANHVAGTTITLLDCFTAYSEDGGATWKETPFPRGDRPLCGDPYLAVDRQGTFFVAFNRLGCPGATDGRPSGNCPTGHVGVARSIDGGRTWSAPVDTGVVRAATPRLRVDQATGKIYVVGAMGPPSPHAISVSADHGVTWSPQAPLPPQPFGNQIAVHDGILATATALKQEGQNVLPAEVIFHVSTDDGKTFTPHRVTNSKGVPVPPPEGPAVPNTKILKVTDPIPLVSADPSRRGRFAIMIPRNDNLEVYITNNSGKGWSGPAIVSAPGTAKPWMEFGPTGNLGVMWRTLDGDMSNVYSAVSFDGGRSFSKTLKVNRLSFKYGYPGTGGDEWSRIMFDGSFVYVTWADARTGGSIDGIYARVPLSMYRR